MSNSKTILLTGAAGFIASHLAERLLDQGVKVIGVDNFNDFYDVSIKYSNLEKYFERKDMQQLSFSIKSPYKFFQDASALSIQPGFSGEANAPSLKNGDFELYGVDLCDYASLRKVFEDNNITHIVHIAALAGVRPSTQQPVLYQKNNGESTINLLNLASEYKIQKFVFASSSSVYGSRSKVPFSPDEDISKPISPYAATKVAGEAMMHTFHHLYKIPSIALRFFTVYGPRQRPDLAITKFTKLISNDEEIQIYGDGTAKRDFTYIDDILDGILKAIDLDCGFEIFNLGESHTTDVNTMVKLLEERIGKKAKIVHTDPIPGDVPITYADISKSKEVLGYDPKTLIADGLTKFVDWFQKTDIV